MRKDVNKEFKEAVLFQDENQSIYVIFSFFNISLSLLYIKWIKLKFKDRIIKIMIILSMYALNHDRIKVIKAYFAISITISSFQHHFNRLFIKVLFEQSVNLLNIMQINITLIIMVIFFKNLHNVLFSFIKIRFCVHSIHELTERYSSSLFNIEFCNYFIYSFFVWIKSVLC